MKRRDDVLAAHVRECDECRAAAPPVDAIAARLAAGSPAIDGAAQWSHRTVAMLRPELAARANAAFWRRLARVLGAALLPLPLVVAADLWWLGRLYDLAAAWLPSTLAADLVLSYGMTLLALLGSAYAAIPLLLASPLRRGDAQPAAA